MRRAIVETAERRPNVVDPHQLPQRTPPTWRDQMSTRSRLILDAGLCVAMLLAYYPTRTGITIHEWLSVALILCLVLAVRRWS